MPMEGRKLYTVEEVRTKVLGEKVGRNALYSAVKCGALVSLKIGKKILITEEALTAWLDSLTSKAS